MADTKISDLTAITGADTAADDDFVVVDTSAAQTKRITRDELKSAVLNTGAVTIGGAATVSGDATFSGAVSLNAIAETKSVTAVDVFVYDTSKDSDGGAWRDRTQATSWYNETLNTATRGARKEFPAVAVIVAEAAKVTIYDGDDPDLPMWRVEDYTGLTLTSINAINGSMAVAASTGLILSSYVEDDIGSTTLDYTTATTPAIVNNAVNDVAMTVLPNAPIDPATGIQVPTIAVATDGGVSVITDAGDVFDITHSNVNFVSGVEFRDDGAFVYGVDGLATRMRFVHVDHQLPTADVSKGSAFVGTDSDEFYPQSSATWTDTSLRLLPDDFSGAKPLLSEGAVSSNLGLNVLAPNPTTPANGMVSYVTSSYNTGWMNGDIKGVFLSDTDDTDVTGGTEPDRSVNANALTVNGTITKTAVATGAELVAYSGFSASNYLNQPYNSDLDFGTGDFCIMGWFNQTLSTSTQYFAYRTDGTNFAWSAGMTATNDLLFVISSDGIAARTAATAYRDNTWNQVAFVREAGIAKIYLNGSLVPNTAAGTSVGTVSLAASLVYIGDSPLSNPFAGSLALIRISATAPTAAQITKIYNDEKFLFQENAACTLYGTSDAVTALAHDDATGLLHVGTSAGRSVFQGLRRVSNTTTAVGTAISASDGLVVEE